MTDESESATSTLDLDAARALAVEAESCDDYVEDARERYVLCRLAATVRALAARVEADRAIVEAADVLHERSDDEANLLDAWEDVADEASQESDLRFEAWGAASDRREQALADLFAAVVARRARLAGQAAAPDAVEYSSRAKQRPPIRPSTVRHTDEELAGFG